MPVINVDKLTKHFDGITAVDNVSFDVKPGEIFGFLGPNGAGKTTVISMLCTLLKPSSGTATVGGFDIVKQRDDVRRSIGLVFQDSSLDEYLTAEQNLRFHAYAYNIPRSEREKRIDNMLELVGLTDRRRSKVSTFSGGMKRRLEIARGLLHHPKVLFLDEPTLGLDPQTRRLIWDHILHLQKSNGLTIFLTTHYMDEAENCHRITILDKGQVIATESPDKLKDSVGGDLVTLTAENEKTARNELIQKFGITPESNNGALSFYVPHGDRFIAGLLNGFEARLTAINIRRPTLEDVFLKLTGRAIRDEEISFRDQIVMSKRKRR